MIPMKHQATKCKTWIAWILCVFLLVGGIALIAYPFVAQAMSARRGIAVQDVYDTAVEGLPQEQKDVLLEEAQRYNADLITQSAVGYKYDEILTIDASGMLGKITIPSLGIQLPIYHGIGDEILAKGVGHMPDTSFPVSGDSVHAVLSAHSGYPEMEAFDKINQLTLGDVFYVSILGETYAYEVNQIRTVLPDEVTELIAIQNGKNYCTLLTCTPYGVNTHRLLVRGERGEKVSFPEPAQEPVGYISTGWWVATILSMAALSVAIILILATRKGRKK